MAMKPGRRSVPQSRVQASEKQRPLSPKLFWICAALTLVYLGVIFWRSIGGTPLETFSMEGAAGEAVGIWPRVFLIGLAVLFLIAALATSEIIPPKGAWTWAHLRRPKVLSQIVFQLLSAAGFVVGIGNIFNTAADQKTAEAIKAQTDVLVTTSANTATKLDDLDSWLRTRFPDDPPVLSEIGGRWGDLKPACEVIWNISIVRRGEDAALIAETVKIPAGVKPYRFVGSITKADPDTLYVEGVEPEAALGSAAHFTFNAATQRLSWDDRARGSGGVEVYRRCEGPEPLQ
ncbi:hypothetical protein [Novosphingobium beihaiensis]|uniref:Uncharacterized protein n=1 Tax=Novosphingobium beihaiensis TaxID=2930389 RepID=A0ABT0BWR9_9SPHN|nr:hypothetical protein [Novosphingobium beihaiensis]MCJ2189271.1 hypothetical protein [Novosphingobium beihaiensis]